MSVKLIGVIGICVLVAASAVVFAGEYPPPDARPLSEIVRSLEDADIGLITSIEFDDGAWEIETRRDGRWMEVHVDPETGEIRRQQPNDANDDLPPTDGLRLPDIIKSVEDREPGVITEVEFDDGFWEFKLHDGRRRITLDIDPRTGRSRGD